MSNILQTSPIPLLHEYSICTRQKGPFRNHSPLSLSLFFFLLFFKYNPISYTVSHIKPNVALIALVIKELPENILIISVLINNMKFFLEKVATYLNTL